MGLDVEDEFGTTQTLLSRSKVACRLRMHLKISSSVAACGKGVTEGQQRRCSAAQAGEKGSAGDVEPPGVVRDTGCCQRFGLRHCWTNRNREEFPVRRRVELHRQLDLIITQRLSGPLFRTVAARSSSLLAGMQRWAMTWCEPMKPKRPRPALEQSHPGCATTFRGLPLPAVPTMPGVRPLAHPALRQRRAALRALRTCGHRAALPGTRLGPPGLQGVLMRRRSRQERLQTRHILRGDLAKQDRWAPPASRPALGRRTTSPPSVSTHRGRWRPLRGFPPSAPRSGPPRAVVLTA